MTQPIIEALSWFIAIFGFAGSVGLSFLALFFSEDKKHRHVIVTLFAAIVLLASTAASIAYLTHDENNVFDGTRCDEHR